MPWPKGTPIRPEMKVKMRRAHLGKPLSVQTRAKMRTSALRRWRRVRRG